MRSELRSSASPTSRPPRGSRYKKHLSTPAVLLLLALAFFGLPQRTAAQTSEADRKKIQKLVREGTKSFRKGRYDHAIKEFNQALELDGSDVQARLGAALAQLKSANYRSCYDQATLVLGLEPDNSTAHALVGLALLRSGYVSEAIASLILSLKNNPKEALAFGGAAEIDYYEGRAREARARAYQAHLLDPGEPDYLITLARSSSRLELFGDAADAYERFLQVAPSTDKERRERIRGLIQFYRSLAGVDIHDINGPKLNVIGFQLRADRRPYIKLRVNGRDATFVLDTGSGFTVLAKEAAKRFGVRPVAKGGKSQGIGGTGKFPIVYGLIRTLEIGDLRIRSVPCFIRPFHGDPERPAREGVDGFIGLSILSHFITELDYQSHRIVLDRETNRAVNLTPPPEVTAIPFRTTQNGLISIETEIDGNHRVNVILDSGASSSVISTAAVDRLKMRDRIVKGQTARVIGAAGVAEGVEIVFIRNYRVADMEHENLRALVLDFSAINETSGFEQSGILGGDFLRQFNVTIDFTRAQLLFRPHDAVTNKRP